MREKNKEKHYEGEREIRRAEGGKKIERGEGIWEKRRRKEKRVDCKRGYSLGRQEEKRRGVGQGNMEEEDERWRGCRLGVGRSKGGKEADA